jgi:hypothetical protein
MKTSKLEMLLISVLYQQIMFNNVVFYTPNMNNNGHDTTISYTSNWLEGFLEPLLTEPIFKNTIFLVYYN